MATMPTRQRSAISFAAVTAAEFALLVGSGGVLAAAFLTALTAGIVLAGAGLLRLIADDAMETLCRVVLVNPFRSPGRCLELATGRLFDSTALLGFGGERLPHQHLEVRLSVSDAQELTLSLGREYLDGSLSLAYRAQAAAAGYCRPDRPLTAAIGVDPGLGRGRYRICPVGPTASAPASVRAPRAGAGRVDTAVLASPPTQDPAGRPRTVAPGVGPVSFASARTRRLNRSRSVAATTSDVGHAALVVYAGFVRVVSTGSTLVVGRGDACDLILADRRVSERHAVFELVGHQWRLRDLSSTNGIFVDGVRRSEVILGTDERIRLGSQQDSAVLDVQLTKNHVPRTAFG